MAADGEIAKDQQHAGGGVQRGIQQGKVNRPRGELPHRFAQLAEVPFKNLLAGRSSVGGCQAPEVAAEVAVPVDDDEVRGVLELITGLALAGGLFPDADVEALDQQTMNVLLLAGQKEPFVRVGLEVTGIVL